MELDKIKNARDVMAEMEAIENGFLKLHDKIVNETGNRPLACSMLLPAIAGSCTLMTYVDVKDKGLYVACAGDNRAVRRVRELAAKGTGHSWKAVPLSFDQVAPIQD
ncbi:hypothetical protein CPB97_001638 [Podila verticillata]|nr:hypothetical protein CPB97_001638 [Podila verticillata]